MEPPARKPLRIKGYDYSSNGFYFVTICAKNRQHLFWDGVGATSGRPPLSPLGSIVEDALSQIPSAYPNTLIDKYVIMPNHVHFILVIQNQLSADGRPLVAPTLSRIIKQTKGYISKRAGFSLWQRSYYDHVIRTDEDYLNIWTYIDTNPLKWEQDIYY